MRIISKCLSRQPFIIIICCEFRPKSTLHNPPRALYYYYDCVYDFSIAAILAALRL